MHRHHPVLAHPTLEAHAVIAVAIAALALNVLEQLSSANSPCASHDNSKSRSASATIPASRAVRARYGTESML